MNLPQGQRGSLVALGLLLIVIMVIFKVALQPAWQAYAGLHEQIDDASFDLQRYRRVAASLPALREIDQRLSTEQPLAPYLLKGDNRALAGASLQRYIQELVGRHGGRILSARTLKHEAAGNLEHIGLNTRFQIDLVGLHEVVYALETGRPFIRIQQLNITSRQMRGRKSSGHLDVRMTVSGLRPTKGGAGRG